MENENGEQKRPPRNLTEAEKAVEREHRQQRKIGKLNAKIFGPVNIPNLPEEPKGTTNVPLDKLVKPWSNWGAKTRWGHGQDQPSPEAKKQGMARRKRNQELARLILGMKFVGLVPEVDDKGKPVLDMLGNPIYMESQFKRRLGSYFGMSAEQIEQVDIETAMLLRQVGQAIEFGDQASAQMMLTRAYGLPRQHIDIPGMNENNQPVLNIVVVNSLSEAEKADMPIEEIELEEGITFEEIKTTENGTDITNVVTGTEDQGPQMAGENIQAGNNQDGERPDS